MATDETTPRMTAEMVNDALLRATRACAVKIETLVKADMDPDAIRNLAETTKLLRDSMFMGY